MKKLQFVCFCLILIFTQYRAQGTPPQDIGREDIVQGFVKDTRGEPIPFASVYITDEKNKILEGTSAGAEGHFILKIKKGAKVLVVSAVGFEKQVLHFPLKDKLTISLKEDEQVLEEVLVTGYMKREKANYSGASFSVNREQLELVNPKTTFEAIQLLVPGLEITENNVTGSNPNEIPDMIIRGRSSFSLDDKKNIPLFVMDGFEVDMSVVFDLNVNEIETITVLKDAAATAFYGAKASNGIILIETKSLEEGELSVSYNTYWSLNHPLVEGYDLLNAREKLEYEKRAGLYDQMDENNIGGLLVKEKYFDKYKRILEGVESDWLAQPIRTVVNMNHSLRVYGGTQKVKYSLSGSYNTNKGVLKESKRNRGSLMFQLQYNANQKISFQNNLRVSRIRQQESPYGSFSQYTRLNPYDRIKTKTGAYNTKLSENMQNPLYEASLGNYDKTESLGVLNNLNFKWQIIEGLRFESLLGVEWYKADQEQFLSPESYIFNTGFKNARVSKREKGSLAIRNNKRNMLQGKASLAYNKTFGEHFLNVNMGANINESIYESSYMKAIGFSSNKLDHISFANSYAKEKPTGSYSKLRQMGAFLNMNYSYANRYFLDVSFRKEGASNFGANAKFASFWSLGAGWNMANEQWLQSSYIDKLRLRVSIGEDGNSNFDAYQAIATYRYDNELDYYSGIGAVPMRLPNPDLQWEKTFKNNFGVDFSFFGDRLYGSFDYYQYKTKSLLLDLSLPFSTGFTSVLENVGKLENKGYEFSLNAHIIKNDKWNLLASISVHHNKNKLVDITDALREFNRKNNEREGQITSGNDKGRWSRKPTPLFEVGESITALKVVKSAGVNPANGRLMYFTKEGKISYKYDYRDKVVVGDKTPKVQGNGGLQLAYKNILFSTNFTYRLGAQKYNTALANKIENVDPIYNVDRRALTDRWKEPNDMTKYTGIHYRANSDVFAPTDRFVAEENMLKINSLNITYQLQEKLLRRIGVRRLDMTLGFTDVLRWSSIKEERGFDYPFARQFTFSLNLTL